MSPALAAILAAGAVALLPGLALGWWADRRGWPTRATVAASLAGALVLAAVGFWAVPALLIDRPPEVVTSVTQLFAGIAGAMASVLLALQGAAVALIGWGAGLVGGAWLASRPGAEGRG